MLWDGAGAVTVEARLIDALRRRGHHVSVLGPASIRRDLTELGDDFMVDASAPPYDAVTDYPADEIPWLRDHVWFGGATAQARAVVELTRAGGFDRVVCDWLLFGAMAGAEASGLPAAALCPGLWARTETPQKLPAEDPGRRFWESGLATLNHAREAVGLDRVGSVFDQRDRLARLLILTNRELDVEGVVLPANARYTGTPAVAAETGPTVDLGGDEPVVMVSFSTSQMAQAAALQRVVDALSTLPVRGVVTLGPAVAPGELRVPGNVVAFQHVPHGAVLPRAAVVVSHAGHGTVIAALGHGVPLVCMPMGRDQFGVAGRVNALGAGVVIGINSSVTEISEAVARVLQDPAYRANAEVLAKAIRASTEAGQAVLELEAL